MDHLLPEAVITSAVCNRWFAELQMSRDGDDLRVRFFMLPCQQVDDDITAHRTVAQRFVAGIGDGIETVAGYAGEDVDQLPISVGIMLQSLPSAVN
jgi:hypothetical protein